MALRTKRGVLPWEFSAALLANCALRLIVICTSSAVLSLPQSFFLPSRLVLAVPGLLPTTLKLRISFKLTTFGIAVLEGTQGVGL